MTVRFIILGAGKSKYSSTNPSLINTDSNSTILGWQLETSKLLLSKRVDYVGGYQLFKLKEDLPSYVHTTYNQNWKETGALYSLLLLDLNEDEDLIVTYNDIIISDSFIKNIFLNLPNDKISYLIDDSFPKRYEDSKIISTCETIGSAGLEAEFTGFIYIPKHFIKILNELKENINSHKNSYLSDFIRIAQEHSAQLNPVNCSGYWSDINIPGNLASFILRGKAKTLENLTKLVKRSFFLDQFYFSTKDWRENKEKIYISLLIKFSQKMIVVRSSAAAEDGFENSACGAFESYLGVDLSKKESFFEIVDKTIAAYGNERNDEDSVLIQPFCDNGIMHGVVFTRTHEGGPYYTFNYTFGSNTENVTKGVTKDHQTTYIISNANISNVPEHLKKALLAVKEIENILNFHHLDVEFVVNEKGECIILQVRPQVQNNCAKERNKNQILQAVQDTKAKLKKITYPNLPLKSKIPSLFAVMPDWNPAEIIGRKPHPLSLSLYETLVTDNIWGQQRYEFGYYDVRNTPLMVNFVGIPYIDVRLSFLSFIPQGLNEKKTNSILVHALNYLKKNPQLHDKVEFFVIPTCYTFNFKEDFQHIFSNFSSEDSLEIETLYKKLTWEAINFDSNKKNYVALKRIRTGKLEDIFLLMDNCKKGILPFAHEARKAFIATAILKSLLDIRAISQVEFSSFFRNLYTISHELTADAYLCQTKKITTKEFIEKYGHLRPGTYDITSQRYDQKLAEYIHPIIKNATEDSTNTFKALKFENEPEIESLLKEIHPKFTLKLFLAFAKESIVSRERVKFEFTKDLSATLENIALYGQSLGISRDDMAYCDMNMLLALKTSSFPQRDKIMLETFIKENKKIANIRNALEMPILFSCKEELDVFSYPSSMPNFVTSSAVSAEIVDLSKDSNKSLRGKIVFIESADPGYDWIFSREILGLVTMYGGVNSHMAVRAAENNIPAVIGIGPDKFKLFSQEHYITLDCKNKKIENHNSRQHEENPYYTAI